MCLLGSLLCRLLVLLLSIKGSANEFVAVVVKEVAGPFTSSWSTNANVSPAQPSIILVPDDLNVKGAWTLLPLIPRLLELHPNVTWVAFLKESTRADWTRLLELTSRFDPAKEWFIGHELYDREPTIVHHFAFHHDPSAFKYPHMEAGILLSRPVLKRMGTKMARERLPSDFSIDVQHELALYLRDAVNLTHSDALCLGEPGPQCATWIQPFKPCGALAALSDVYFAVKTCSKFHKDRLPVIQKTWGNRQVELTFFSDLEDESIPTMSLGVPNTESGHCSKTMAIIDHLAKEKSRFSWYVIADDDTILGVRELRELLSCYDPSHPLLIGQKYGFASGHQHGYDYITGGGGMVLSRAALVLIAGNPNGRCPQADTPDDMWLGSFAETLGVSIVHFSGFHQARPDDYPLRLLQSQHVVSFHKHWMIDPLQVYSDWFSKDKEEKEMENWMVESDAALSDLLDSRATSDGLFQRQLADEL